MIFNAGDLKFVDFLSIRESEKEDSHKEIRPSEVVHTDETFCRNNGQGRFVWFAGYQNLAFFHVDRHRSAVVAQTLFGEDFDGTLVRDRYTFYNYNSNFF